MEQKKKKQEDVLVVRDEKTGEISVVAGLNADGTPKRTPAKAENAQSFLQFDRHGDMVDNFFKNFYRQCKEPTRFGFYRVAADAVDTLLPVIKDFLKDPVANAEILASHKVDTAKYQQQAETENVKQEKNNNEPIKKTEEMEKKEELKQEKDVQQPQVAETQEKPNLIADDQVNWEELRKCGIDKEKLSEKDLKALMNYGKTGLVTVKPTFGYESYELQARLSFQKMEDGYLKLTPHFIRNEPRLDIPHRGYTFTEEDKKTLKRTGNLGKPVNFANEKTGEIKPHYISIDRKTNEITDIPASRVRIPERIGKTEITTQERDMLRAGLPVRDKLIERNDGRKFVTTLQVNVEQRGVEFVPGTGKSPRTAQTQETKGDTSKSQAQGGENAAQTKKEQRRNTWTNEDGSIRPISKWSGVSFTDQQKADYVAGKAVKLENVTDKQGFHATMYIKFNPEKGRPYRYDTNPDNAQQVAPSNESRTQVAVNNDGKTNEATKNLREPLQKGQTNPKDARQQQQQAKKSKGMKVSS